MESLNDYTWLKLTKFSCEWPFLYETYVTECPPIVGLSIRILVPKIAQELNMSVIKTLIQQTPI